MESKLIIDNQKQRINDGREREIVPSLLLPLLGGSLQLLLTQARRVYSAWGC